RARQRGFLTSSTSSVSCSTGRRGRIRTRGARKPQSRDASEQAAGCGSRLRGLEGRAGFIVLAEREERGAEQQVRVVDAGHPALRDPALDGFGSLRIVARAVVAEPHLHVHFTLRVLRGGRGLVRQRLL